MLDEYLAGVLGDRNVASWLIAWTFVLIGVIISLGIHASKRSKASSTTPYTFSWGFLFRDNIIRLVSSIFACFALIRFGEEATGFKMADMACLGLGLLFDQLLIVLEKWQDKARTNLKLDE